MSTFKKRITNSSIRSNPNSSEEHELRLDRSVHVYYKASVHLRDVSRYLARILENSSQTTILANVDYSLYFTKTSLVHI